jgi:hypothetical protein
MQAFTWVLIDSSGAPDVRRDATAELKNGAAPAIWLAKHPGFPFGTILDEFANGSGTQLRRCEHARQPRTQIIARQQVRQVHINDRPIHRCTYR